VPVDPGSVGPVPARPVPVDLADVAADVAGRAVSRADPVSGVVARVGVDGAVPADRALVADAVRAAVEAAGRPVLRVRSEDFWRPRSLRLEHGPADPDSAYAVWVDHAALRREVLDPLGPGRGPGPPRWLPTLWDAEADRATRAAVREALPGSVAVVDGPFLLRPETADAFDLCVHLQTSPEALARRLHGDELARTAGAWQRYLDEAAPQDRADVVLRFERPTRPALVRR
jgi:hypothetical protein